MRFILRRLVIAIPVLLVVTFLSFLLLNLLPGDPSIDILGPSATQQARAQVRHDLGLDEAILPRYGKYLDHLVHGQLGKSYLTQEPVASELRLRLPVTLELMVLSQLLAFAVALPLGILAARRPGSALDRLSSAGAFGLLSIPPFVIGVFLVFLFAVRLHLLPASGFTHLSDSIGKNLRSMVLPSVTLAAGSVALYLRVLRSDMIATLQQDFITTARATGMRDRGVLLRHAFKPSSFTLLTVAGLNIAVLIGGAVLVEDVFQLPGIGLLAVTAIQQRDYLTVQGVVVVAAVGFVAVNLVVDILYGLLDPRVRSAHAIG